MNTVHLLRHAKPLPPDGTTDVSLSEAGRSNAVAIVPILGSLGIRRIVSSPYKRALETVQPFAACACNEKGTAVDTMLEIDARLRERDMPLAEGPEHHIEQVRISFGDADFAPEGGESFRQTSARALSCLRGLLKETPAGLLLVGHGQCLTLILRSVDERAGFEFWKSLPTPAIVELKIDEEAESGSFRLLELSDFRPAENDQE